MILGVSPDTVESHAKWKTKLKIPYPLLADVEHVAADAYGVWVERTSASTGQKYWGVARTTFVIDERGHVAQVFPKVQVQGHSQEVLSAVKTSSPPGRSPE